MNVDEKVRFVTYRYAHHSSHSGYDILANYGGKIVHGKAVSKKIVRHRVMWKLANGMIAYDWEALGTELKTARELFKTQNLIYHILYGENTYHYLAHLNNRNNNRLVVSYHLPPQRFKEVMPFDWHIRKLSAVVVVGRNQIEMFADLLGPDKVFYVPHGVDIDYFTPPASFAERDPNLVLYVGNHLRDFATLRGVIELVAFQRPEVKFVVVTARDNFERVGVHPNVDLRTRIPESELYDLFRTASLMLMPLQDATANNSVLEGLACGLPAVVTDVGSIRDYVTPDCGVLIPPNESLAMAQTVLSLLADRQRLEAMSVQAREQAIQFAWPKIIEQLIPVYESIL
ncbi:MAG: glycosyltransferase family 4 protein [Chloroflexota bacterium]|nr:glycosyltransferase family 4 protein [Anaerolineales bacterium]MCB8968167.1 glycosyltransferase family 4 protein [Ardenticatenaceae bacterium]